MLFLVTIFLSAFLLFQVQPFIANVILPYYGGSASVWTTCMLFFQGVLLLGYGYAHVLNRLPISKQQSIHLVLVVIACAVLPFSPPIPELAEISQNPSASILLTLATAIGLPYALLASTGPLVQSWYAHTHQDKVPYKLYALSNAGSLLALLSYPFVVEPALALSTQTVLWSSLFIVFALAIALLSQLAKRYWHTIESDLVTATLEKVPSTHKSLWLALSALGVMLLVSTTNAMTQNITPVPFLWVLPLILYLVTFIIAFNNPNFYKRWYWLAFYTLAAFMGIMLTFVGSQFDLVSQVVMYSFILFAGCMICHGELIKLAPAKQHLTLFYLMISLGGFLGSLMVSILAPMVFVQFTEYPLSIIAILIAAMICFQLDTQVKQMAKWALPLIGVITLGLAALQLTLDSQYRAQHVANERNFYGLLSVVDTSVADEPERRLIDGTTSHGTQSLAPLKAHIAKSYYRENTGGALALSKFIREQFSTAPLKAGFVGLGAGAMAAYGQVNQEYTFYELNPAVVDFADRYFSYLRDSKADINVQTGDGRLLLQQALNQQGSMEFDVLVIDAFSGDAIPRHLLTVEAFELYNAHLASDGILALHISNTHLDLSALTHNLAKTINKPAYYFNTKPTEQEPNEAQWVLVTANQKFIESYSVRRFISEWPASKHLDVMWHDNYSNLLSVLK
ncbi:spermidine synthase [Thalassotalea euphylliae]|uniref:spermidine synthase n=1 Tax=Thalassotalea euphylliae TaxID=1655234 RepID=UPI003625E154